MPVAVVARMAAPTGTAAADHDARTAVGIVIAVAARIIVTAAAIVRARASYADADSSHADVNAERHCWHCGGEHCRRRDCERKLLHKQLSSGSFLSEGERTSGNARSMAASTAPPRFHHKILWNKFFGTNVPFTRRPAAAALLRRVPAFRRRATTGS